MADLIESNTAEGVNSREQQLLDVLGRFDGERLLKGEAVACWLWRCSNMLWAAAPLPVPPIALSASFIIADAPSASCMLTGQLLVALPSVAGVADAYFNQDAKALKSLLADNVVQHAGVPG
jgi:hypothetical protein